jgi:exodeoxyribonuclease VII large subunit
MNDSFGPLFESSNDAQLPDEQSRTYGVHELNSAIERALQDAFPQEIWIRGEIQGLARTRMRRHWYFELVEKESAGDGIKSRIPVALLQWNRGPVDRELRDTPGFDLQDDLEVRIRCQVGYYAPWGKLQLIMVGVDPAFTLGRLAASRERTLRALAAEGLLERNARLLTPLVPQTLGLITSEGSAAYNDFIEEIGASAFAFRIRLIDARVQGAEMEPTILAALAHFARRPPDVVVIIRGGGSRADLAGFDSEAIARAIANMPVPVWTGIGHEIDSSVADAVAHRSFKTPTACAAALVGRVEEFLEYIDASCQGIMASARQQLEAQEAALGHAARNFSRLARRSGRERRRQLQATCERLGREAGHSVRRHRQELDRRMQRGLGAARLRLARSQASVDSAALRLTPGRLHPLIQRRLLILRGLARQLVALDPRRILSRGFSLSYAADGALIRSAGDLTAGSLLRSVFADGEATSTVLDVRKTHESEGETP